MGTIKKIKVRPTKKRQRYLLFIAIVIFAGLIVFPITFTPGYLNLTPKSTVIILLKFGNISQDDTSLINYVKEDILVPPAPVNKSYNFSDTPGPSTNLSNPSEFKQNLVVLEIFKQINKTSNGFFIEYGAMDGGHTSNTLYFEQNFNWTGLLIEPHLDLYESLNSSNRKAWTANSCLSLKPYPELLSLPKLGYYYRNFKSKTKLQCFPLYTFLLSLQKSVIDYFMLDFEGAELEILQTIPYEKVKFLVIEVKVGENNNGLIKSYLKNQGYVWYKSTYQHYIFIHESLKGNVTFPKPDELSKSQRIGQEISIMLSTLLVLINLS